MPPVYYGVELQKARQKENRNKKVQWKDELNRIRVEEDGALRKSGKLTW